MYSQESSYRKKPNDRSDPYETEFTARTLNDTAPVRERRGFGTLLVNAIPGLITLAIESVSSYIKGKQQQRINTMVEELRNDDNKIRNHLRQHGNELLMYGRYKLNSLRGVINTINALHNRQTYYERAVRQGDFNFRRSDMDAVNYNFDILMYLDNAMEEHIVTYR